MSDFGDFDPEDAYDLEPADPEQVAMRMHKLRMALEELAGENHLPRWDQLDPAEQSLAYSIGGVIVDWLATHEPDDPEKVAEHLHNVRRYWGSPARPWDELSDDERGIGIWLFSVIIMWLTRQGAIA